MAKNVLAICVLLWAPMALANQVTQVSAKDGNVRITADEPPNFTTFTIDYPPRLVVDLAGATLVDVPTNIPVGQNGVQGIQTLPYGSGTSAVARIIIMYEKPVQTDILTDGNSIVVRQAESPAPAAAPPSPPASPQAPVLAKAQAAPPPPSPTPAAPGPPPVEQAAAAPPSPAPSPEPAAPQLAAPIPASPRPAASEPLVAVAPPSQPPRNPDNAAPEAPAQPAPQPQAVVAEREPAAQATSAYEDQAVPPAATPSAPPPPAPAPTAAEAPPLKINTEAQLASPPPPAATEEPPHVSARRKTLSLVGLRFNNGATSVFVRTNEPVSYRVSQRPNGLVVTIENTRITRRNDSRPLDAQFFDSPVAKVRASQNRGDVEVTIDLKTQAPYQATQTGREVELSFSQKKG